jgi:hypothetical protein
LTVTGSACAALQLSRPGFQHFANDQFALMFRVDGEPLARAPECLFFAGGGDDADIRQAIAVLSVDAPHARFLLYASHRRALFLILMD